MSHCSAFRVQYNKQSKSENEISNTDRRTLINPDQLCISAGNLMIVLSSFPNDRSQGRSLRGWLRRRIWDCFLEYVTGAARMEVERLNISRYLWCAQQTQLISWQTFRFCLNAIFQVAQKKSRCPVLWSQNSLTSFLWCPRGGNRIHSYCSDA